MTTTATYSASIGASVPIEGPVQRLNPWKDRFRLACGPMIGGLVYLFLPETYAGASGSVELLGQAGRATAAVGVWMAARNIVGVKDDELYRYRSAD